MDIEQYPYTNNNGDHVDVGWHNVFNYQPPNIICGGPISGSVTATEAAATFNGFWDYIHLHTPYMPAVYSSGYTGAYDWDGIFGSKDLTNTAEWTFWGVTGDINPADWPTGWNVPSTHAYWFAGVSSTNDAGCRLAWQWTNDTVNSADFRLDQIYGPNRGTCD
jgi:hypothetical protein